MPEPDLTDESFDPSEALRRAESRLHSALPLRSGLEALLGEVRECFFAEASSFALTQPDGGSAYIAAVGAGGDQVVGTPVPPGEDTATNSSACLRGDRDTFTSS